MSCRKIDYLQHPHIPTYGQCLLTNFAVNLRLTIRRPRVDLVIVVTIVMLIIPRHRVRGLYENVRFNIQPENYRCPILKDVDEKYVFVPCISVLTTPSGDISTVSSCNFLLSIFRGACVVSYTLTNQKEKNQI